MGMEDKPSTVDALIGQFDTLAAELIATREHLATQRRTLPDLLIPAAMAAGMSVSASAAFADQANEQCLRVNAALFRTLQEVTDLKHHLATLHPTEETS